MPGLTPKEPPIKAYRLLKPDKRRQVDAAPAAERDVLAWLLLLAAGQDSWHRRKHPCLVCEKSGWPCLDPKSPGNRIRCEGCYLAGYHCQTIPSRLEPSTNVGSTPKDKDSGSSEKTKRIIRRVYSSESDSDSQSSVSDARQRSPKNDNAKKRNRTDSSPATPHQASSSDIQFFVAYEPEETPMTPTPPRELSHSPHVNASPPPASPTKSTKTAVEFFQELFGHYASSDEDSSDSSDSAPLALRPLPISPVPALNAPSPTTKATAPDSGETHQPTARLETPSDGQSELSGYSDSYNPLTPAAAPSWKSSCSEPTKEPGKELRESSEGINPTGGNTEEDELELDVKEEQEEFCGQAPDSSLKQQYDKADASDASDASKAPSPEETTQQPPSSTPIVLNSLQQLSVLKAAQDTAQPSFALSFNGEKAGSGGKTKTTVIVVPAARSWTDEMVPWHLLLCERSTNCVMVIFNSQEPHNNDQGLYSTSALTKTLPQGYLNGLEVPKAPQTVVWKPCKSLEGISGPVWTTCVAIWLSRGGDLHEKLENLSSVSIREQFVIPQFNSLLQGQKLASTCISVN